MNYIILFIILILVIMSIWELSDRKRNPKHLLKKNKRLTKRIAENRKKMNERAGSWERKQRSESRRLRPFWKKKKGLEDDLKNKVDKWLDDELDEPFINH